LPLEPGAIVRLELKKGQAMSLTGNNNELAPDRRGSDRRKAKVQPLPIPDRRKEVRRSGQDRRAAPRFG
jgi:hypothetical protein